MAKKKRTTRTQTTATTAKPPKTLPRSSRRSRAEQPILDDARLVAQAARKHLKGFQKYDADRKKKLFPASRLDAFDTRTRAASILVGGKRTRKATSAAATRIEEKARAVVYAMVIEMRGVVDLGLTDEDNAFAMRKAFLVGAKVDAKSTPDLITGAADLQQAWASKDFNTTAIALGIKKAMIAKLVDARRALIKADTSQGAVHGERVGETAEKTAALRAVERETTYIRKVAKLAFRGQPKILEAFRKKTPLALMRTSRKAVAGSAGGPPPGSPT